MAAITILRGEANVTLRCDPHDDAAAASFQGVVVRSYSCWLGGGCVPVSLSVRRHGGVTLRLGLVD